MTDTSKASIFISEPHIYTAVSPEFRLIAHRRWVLTEAAQHQLRVFRDVDRTAWQELLARMTRAARTGIRPGDVNLRAPIGDQFRPRINGPQPWLGELKQAGSAAATTKKKKTAVYRLYFGDCDSSRTDPPRRMLAVLFAEKWTSSRSEDQPMVRKRQNKNIEEAMKAIIFWCGANGRAYRPLSAS